MPTPTTPDPEAVGAGEVAPPVVPPAPPAKPAIDPSTAADLAELRALRADKAQRDADAKARADADLREKGRFEDLLKSRDEELARARTEKAEAVERSKRTTLAKDLATELSKVTLRPGAVKQLTKLLADELEVVPDGDEWVTRSKDRRSVADFIAETLKSPEYDGFISSTARPGAGANGSRAAETPPPPQAPKPPANLGEALISVFNEVRANPSNELAGPRGFRRLN